MPLQPARESTTPTLTLERVLDLLQNVLEKRWCREFLLSTASASDQSILTSKTHLLQACSGQFKLDFSGANSVQNLFLANWHIIPAFHFEPGYSTFLFSKELFGEMEGWRTISSCLNDATKYRCGAGVNFSRAVRDHISGIFVGIDLDSGYNFTEVMVVTTNRTSKSRQRAYFRVPKDLLRAHNFHAIRASVHIMQYSAENPACETCLLDICGCEPPNHTIPGSPLDVSAILSNSAMTTAVFVS